MFTPSAPTPPDFTKLADCFRLQHRADFIREYVMSAVNGNAVLTDRMVQNLHKSASEMFDLIYP